MLAEGKPDRGLAFGALWKTAPSKSAPVVNAWKWAHVGDKLTGTGDMVSRMLRAGLPVRWVESPDAEAVDLTEMPAPPKP